MQYLQSEYRTLQPSPDNEDDKGGKQAEQDHRRDREIESEILLFNPYISGQPADPVQFVMKEIDDDTEQNDKNSPKNDVSARIAVHSAKV